MRVIVGVMEIETLAVMVTFSPKHLAIVHCKMKIYFILVIVIDAVTTHFSFV